MNKYQANLEAMLAESSWLSDITNDDKQQVNFDDLIWKCQIDSHICCNLIFVDTTKSQAIGVNVIKTTNFRSEWALSLTKRKVLALYVADRIKATRSAMALKGYFYSARHAISHCDDLTKLQQREVDSLFIGSCSQTVKTRIAHFIRWLVSHKLCPSNIKVPSVRRNNDRYDALYKNQQKKPGEENLIALGAICNTVIPVDETKWTFSPKANLRNALICTLSTLAMSSPTRITAEFLTMPLQSVEPEKNEKGKTVYRLSLQGSKGFVGNYTHVLHGMANRVQQVIMYMKTATEPGRILARFYQNPEAELQALIPEGIRTPFQDDRIAKLGLELDKPVHLFQLGLIIGFYPLDHTVSVPKVPGQMLGKGRATRKVALATLTEENKILVSEKEKTEDLLGTGLSKKNITQIFGGNSRFITIREFQLAWIAYIKRLFPSFPWIAHGSNQTKLEVALFSFTGRQLLLMDKNDKRQRGRMARPGSSSFYALVPGVSLANMFLSDLSHQNPTSNIFYRHGFSSEFSITPHQFRHYLNDYGEKQGIPHRILNLWSGRKSPEHLLHYIHSTELERSTEVAGIMFKEDNQNSRNTKATLRITSMEEYQKQRGQSAHIASTTSVGFCTQDLNLMPCSYMNELVSQCTFCKRACHVAHDEKAIAFLKDDLEFQCQSLVRLKTAPHFAKSDAMRLRYKKYKQNTALLSKLIELMEDPVVKPGTVIRVLLEKLEFRITDLQLKQISNKRFTLGDVNSELNALLLEINTTPENTASKNNDFIAGLLSGI